MLASYVTRFIVVASCLNFIVSAWYLEVHNQIGYVADQLLEQPTKQMLATILEPEYQGSIGRAAAWADTVSRTTAKYSYGWHWISAKDDPPRECGLYYHRDCQEGGCVVQQIWNQTQILIPCVKALRRGDYQPDVDCQQALKWIIHFTMDVCEPMHTSLRAFGGNTFEVTFNGQKTNMHQTWDRWILYHGTNHTDGFDAYKIDPFFQALADKIQADRFRTPRKNWAICDFDIGRGTYCGELWAQDSNYIVCDFAYGRFVNGTDLAQGYAQDAFHIVELQLAKAAWRIAGWLNTIATSDFGGSAMNAVHAIDGGLEDLFANTGRPFLGNPGIDGGYRAGGGVVEQTLRDQR